MLDDAHHDDHLLKDIKVEVDKHKGRVKCILTVRDILFSALNHKIPSHGRDMLELLYPSPLLLKMLAKRYPINKHGR